MAERGYFYIQQWVKDEQKQDDRDNLVCSNDDSFTLYGDVPMIEENNPHNGE
jgi:hypothetical protein